MSCAANAAWASAALAAGAHGLLIEVVATEQMRDCLQCDAAQGILPGALHEIVEKAESGTAYDQLIGAGNEEGNAVVQAAIDALIAQTRNIERAVAAVLTHALTPLTLTGCFSSGDSASTDRSRMRIRVRRECKAG